MNLNYDIFKVKDVRGSVTISYLSGKDVVRTQTQDNLIVLSMREVMAGIFIDQGSSYPLYIKIGQSNALPNVSQIDLVTSVAKFDITDFEVSDSLNRASLHTDVGVGSIPTGTYREMGLFAGNGKMMSRIVLNPNVFCDSSTAFRVRWDLYFSA